MNLWKVASRTPTVMLQHVRSMSVLSQPSWSLAALRKSKAGGEGNVDEETVERMAKLSNLHVADGDKHAVFESVRSVIEWTSLIKDVDTDGVEPMYTPVPRMSRLRPDEVKETIGSESVLRNAKHKDRGHFLVPKVVDLADH